MWEGVAHGGSKCNIEFKMCRLWGGGAGLHLIAFVGTPKTYLLSPTNPAHRI